MLLQTRRQAEDCRVNSNLEWLEEHSAASLRRLLPRIEARWQWGFVAINSVRRSMA